MIFALFYLHWLAPALALSYVPFLKSGATCEYCGDGCQSGNCYPEDSHNGMITMPTCGREAGGAECPDQLCCSRFGWCGDGEAFCGIGCQNGDCFDLFGDQEQSKDDDEDEDGIVDSGTTGHDDTMMPIDSSGTCLTNTTTGEKYCNDPSHCCSAHNYCGLGNDKNYCGDGCIGGACWASAGAKDEANETSTDEGSETGEEEGNETANQEGSNDDDVDEGGIADSGITGHDGTMMPIDSSGTCLTNATTGEKYCNDPSHCCSAHNYCGLGNDTNYCGDGCIGGACWASAGAEDEANETGTDEGSEPDMDEGSETGTDEGNETGEEEGNEAGMDNLDIIEEEGGDGVTKEAHHGTGYGSGIGMYAVCVDPTESISNDDLETSVANEVIVGYQYALNTDEDANLDEVLTLLEYQVHDLLLEEKMDCSLVDRRNLQAKCYPEAIVSSPKEIEVTDTVCQESEGMEGKNCHVIDGGFGVFLGRDEGCSLFAEDQIRQDYLAWISEKMSQESRTGVPQAIENVDGAAGISFRGAIMSDNRSPVIGGSVSGFSTQNTGEDVSSKGVTALGELLPKSLLTLTTS